MNIDNQILKLIKIIINGAKKSGNYGNYQCCKKHDPGWVDGLMPLMGGWMVGWMGVKAIWLIAYSNQKLYLWLWYPNWIILLTWEAILVIISLIGQQIQSQDLNQMLQFDLQ